MFTILQILTVILLATSMSMALAHALELPGKLRLDKEKYYSVQSIYYPGFTIGGVAEAVSVAFLALLIFLTPRESGDFRLTISAFVGMLGMQTVYWLITHPINKFWVQKQQLGAISAGFFKLFGSSDQVQRPPAWTQLRDRWEYSHVARAALGFLSFVAMLLAVSSAD